MRRVLGMCCVQDVWIIELFPLTLFLLHRYEVARMGYLYDLAMACFTPNMHLYDAVETVAAILP